MTVGGLPWADLHAQATRLAELGGAPVDASATRLEDLAVTGPAEILSVSRALTASGGAAVMSSGGTTGRPKLTFVAHHQAIDRLAAQWRPLAPGNLLLNLFTPGRLWASHYYMQTLAERSGCHVAPAGPYGADEVGDWLDMFRDIGVNALAGTPSALADLAQGVLDTGSGLDVRTIIWMAEPWTPTKHNTVRAAFPDAGFFGNYGSVETFVIATNDPGCDLSTLHLLPDQVIELDDGGALLSRRGDGWTVPTIRYRLGDRLTAATCRCGRADGLRVLGRADDAIKLHGALFGIGDILAGIRDTHGVTEAQLLLTRGPQSGHTARRMEVHFTGTAEPDDVANQLTRSWYDLPPILATYPQAVAVNRVDRLRRVDRTNKVPPMIWLDPSDDPADDED